MWLLTTFVILLVAVAAVQTIRLWWKYRGARVVSCPENHRPAGVAVATANLATQAFTRSPQLRLSTCSRWPEKAGCGQECLSQIAAAPEDCLVRNILVRWYAGKQCVSCGQPFGAIPLAGARPAILSADRNSVEWSQIPADRLEDTLADGSPICFACHMGNLLVRYHPELAVDRHRSPEPSVQKSGDR